MAMRLLFLLAAASCIGIAFGARALRKSNSTAKTTTEILVAGKNHTKIIHENVSFVVHSIAHAKRQESRSCGPNTLEVGKDIYQEVMAQSTHVDYMCECLEMNVKKSLYVGDDNMRAKIGTSGASKDFSSGSAEQRLCQAIEYTSMFVNEDSCQYWVSPDSMDDLCSEHYQYDL
eukprot:gnl/TRDRNA2_/TRDRNA2_167088_c0_seq2.p1 gnl/TRDRNA2_/TRDRNA2_167088_c0~~gnl/TRDRNA2_/TRDRNA2_167088_c0_seq2.p1  ORF type:complete len:174 (+),score=43.43 gnl/TRDRNA2_/TRDRNA2_167088_c0_seq2:95-616(+)